MINILRRTRVSVTKSSFYLPINAALHLTIPGQAHQRQHPKFISSLPLSRSYSSTPIGQTEKPTYQLTFTCKACTHRSSHIISKQAYHKGTVLVQCPSCTNRHLIADHLNVFGQGKKTLEDILHEKGDGETIQYKTIDFSKIGDIQWEGPGQAPELSKLE